MIERRGRLGRPFRFGDRNGAAPWWTLLIVGLLSLVACRAGDGDLDTLATFASGRVTVEQMDAEVRGRSGGQPTDPRAWLETRIGDRAIHETLRARASAARLADDPDLVAWSRYVAAFLVARDFLVSRCADHMQIDEARLEVAYRAAYPQPERAWLLLRHVYKRRTTDDGARARAEMLAVLEMLDQGRNFAEVATRESDSATATEGGLIGRVSRAAEMEPTVLAAAWALDDGEYSREIEVDNGFHVVLREASGVERRPPLATVRAELNARLRQEARDQCAAEQLADAQAQVPASTVVSARAGDGAEADGDRGDEALVVETQLGAIDAGTVRRLRDRFGLPPNRVVEAFQLAGGAALASPAVADTFGGFAAHVLDQSVITEQWRREAQRAAADLTPTELRQAFETARGSLTRDAEIDVGILSTPVASAERPRRILLDTAWDWHAQVGAGTPFEALARRVSDDASAIDGGRLGPVSVSWLAARFGPEVLTAIGEVAIGEISEPLPVLGEARFVVFRVYGRQEPHIGTFEDMKTALLGHLANTESPAVAQKLRRHLLSEIDFRLDARAVEAYLAAR